jgi:hypothetical protein
VSCANFHNDNDSISTLTNSDRSYSSKSIDFDEFQAAFIKTRKLRSLITAPTSKIVLKWGDTKIVSDATNNTELINIMATTNATEMTLVCNIYKDNYGRELEADLNVVTDGKFNKLLVAMITNPSRYEAEILYNGLHASSVDFRAIRHVLVGRTHFELNEIKQSYLALSPHVLEYDINKILR